MNPVLRLKFDSYKQIAAERCLPLTFDLSQPNLGSNVD
jgi:hypothetical protein